MMDSKIIKILEEKIIEIQEKSADFKEKKTIYEAYKSVVSLAFGFNASAFWYAKTAASTFALSNKN